MADDHCRWCGSPHPGLTTAYDARTVHDARQPSIPVMGLCIHCADTLSDYMSARASASDGVDEDLRTLAAHEAESVLDALAANPGLEAVTPSWVRIRRLGACWMQADVPVGEFRFSEVDRERAGDVLADARRVSVRPASARIWGDYEEPARS